MNKSSFDEKFQQLTKQREAVLEWLLAGKSDEDAAAHFTFQENTYRSHISQIGTIFGFKTEEDERSDKRTALVKLFLKHKPEWVKPEAIAKYIESDNLAPVIVKASPAPEPVKSNDTNAQAHPAYFNVPNPSRYFKGRDTDLATLWQTFRSSHSTCQIQVITGMGGMGKTQLAIQYAHQHKQDYSLVWWLRAEAPATLAEDFANLAAELDLPEKAADDQTIRINAVKRWLSVQTRWLLIFDNTQDLKDVEPYLLSQASGYALITSQKQSGWRSRAIVLPLFKLPLDATIAFLLEQTRQNDHPAATELAQNLDGLPLALAQASAYIDRTGCTIQAYLNLFRTCQAQLLDRGSIAPDYNLTVATTWQLAFEAIAVTAPAAAELLNLCAFLAPDDIPEALFQHQPEDLLNQSWSAFTNPLEFEDAIATLRDYSLIERGEDSLSLHRLVQAVTISRLTKLNQKEVIGNILQQVKEVLLFDYYDKNAWAIFQSYLPHAIVVIDHANNLEIVNDNSIIIQSNIGQYLVSCGRTSEAEFYLTVSIENTKNLIQTQHFYTEDLDYLLIESYSFLSSVYQDKNQVERTIECHVKELELCTRLYGGEHSRTISALRCVGCSYIHKEELEIGEKLILQALERSKNRDRDVAMEKAYSIMLLGVVASKRQEWHRAISFYRQAESHFSAAGFNETHHELGVLFYRIMQAYEALGDLARRDEYFSKARAALEYSQINHYCNLDFKELRQSLGLAETV